MFGCHTLAVRLLAWETLCPKLGALPQIAHLAMGSSVNSNPTFYHGRHENAIPPLFRSPSRQGEILPADPFPPRPPFPPSRGPSPSLVTGSRSPYAPRGRDLRAHGRGGEDPGGIPRLVRRRGEGTVHPRSREE